MKKLIQAAREEAIKLRKKADGDADERGAAVTIGEAKRWDDLADIAESEIRMRDSVISLAR